MNNKGYISILVLLSLLGITFVLGANLDALLEVQELNRNSILKLKSYSACEGKILWTLDDKYYEKEVYPYLKSRKLASSKIIRLEKEDLINSNEDRITKLTRDNFTMFIESGSLIEDMRYSLIGEVELINPIFLKNRKDFEENYSKFWKCFYEDLDKDIYNTNEYLDEIYSKTIKKPGVNYLYREEDYNVIENVDGSRFLFDENRLRLFFLSNSSLIIGQKGDFPLKNMEGILIVEGSIVIKEDFNFKGIIICKDGDISLDKDIDFNVKGVVISNNFNIKEKHEHDKNNALHKYGYILPGLIDPELLFVKYGG